MALSGAKRKVKNKADNSSEAQANHADSPQANNAHHSHTLSSSYQRAETMAAMNAALLQATDEASILAAVAEYADAQGAAGVLLNYATPGENITSADFTPVARWIFKHPFPYRVIDESNEKFHDVIIEIRDLALREPGNIFYLENVETDERLSAESRADFLPKYPMRAEAMLGLYSGGRWQGSLIIMWHQPHEFNDEERYVYEQIVQNLSAVVATRRAYLAEQDAREEATTLYKVSEAVNAAKTYDELLQAVAVLEPQADSIYLFIWENFDFQNATHMEVAAIHNMQGESPIKPGTHLQKSEFPYSTRSFTGRFWFVEDIHADPTIDATSRASWDALNTRAVLMVRLIYGETRIGSIAFHSSEPRTFSERKRRLALAIGDLVTAAVERIRLAQSMQAAVEAQAQAYVDEQSAREEMSLLYQASEAINTASTFGEVIKAIAPLARSIERVYLFLWEHLDYRKAKHFDLVAGINQDGEMPVVVGTRFREDQFPIAPHVAKARQLAIEDIHNHPLVDPVTRDSWDAANARALLLVALVQNQRWYGTLSFESSTPRQYSERDRRLTLAISDLVASAIIRIQAQQETAAAHAESAFLYQLAGEINAATTYQEMVDSVARLQPDSSGIFMSFFENLDLDFASYADTIAYSSVSEKLKKHIKTRTPVITSTIENLRHERVWASDDFLTDPRFDETGRNYYLNTPVRSGIVIPLRAGERIWGMMTFYYPEAHHFSDQELRIAAGIGDLVSAAVERIRLQRETVVAKEEADFLYQLAEQINAATTYQEIVDSVAHLQTESNGVFLGFFENLDLSRATYSETVAHSALSEPLKSSVKYRVPIVSTIEKLQYDSVWISENFFTDSRFDKAARDFYRDLPVRSSVVIPLRAGERIWGTMTFYFPEPRKFSEQEQRIAMGIGDLVSAAVERIRLQRETVVAKEEADFLYQLAEQINAATSYQAILDAVVRLMPDSEGVFLNLCENFDFDNASYFEVPVGANVPKHFQWMIGTRIPKASFPFANEVRDQRLVVVDNVKTDPRIDQVSRESWEAIGTRALMAVLFHREGRLFGWLLFVRSEPHVFIEHDRRLAMGIGDLAKAAIERIHLQQETIAAKEESHFLYQLAEQINAATSYQTILDAVVRLMPDSEGVFLNVCENFDFDNGSTFDVVSGANVPEQFKWMVGVRVPKNKFPFALNARDQRIVIVSDVQTDPDLDTVIRKDLETIGVRAMMGVLFHREERLFGWLLFVRTEPYVFTEHDRRLAMGIGDLAKAAIERIRLQQETIAAKEESHFLYQLAEQINAATGYQAILDAVVRLLPDCEGVYLNLYENFDIDRANYFEIPVAANIPEELQYIVGMRIPKERFPMAEQLRDQRLLVIEDTETDLRADEVSRSNWKITGTRALVIVTFYREGRLFGWMFFNKSQPYHFPERDLRLILGIGDLAKAAVERIYLQQETMAARQHAETLANLNAAFSRAVNELDLLRAFVPFAESIGAYRVEMAYADYNHEGDPFGSYLIALWMNGEFTDYRQPGHQIRHVSSKDYMLGALFLPRPDQVMYSPDIANESRLDPERRLWMKTQLTMGAAVILPFMHAGEFQGLISINWKEPHIFSDDERFILERLLQTLPAVIATRRVYIAEQEARAENELLYTVGKEINRAKTNNEVMEAVNRCFPDPLYVAIFMWENYDRNKATYTETVISTDPGLPAGTRLPRDVFDLSSTVAGKVQIIHDVNAPEWLDDAAAGSARRFGIMSVAFTSLVENQRVVGVFAIGCKKQRNFTDREIRLMSGVTELTGAALERFRLRDETERARQRAHDLAALEERTRLARELHDSVSQALYGIGLGAQTAYRSLDKNPTIVRESVEYVLTLAEAGLAEMRALIFELRPESLETEGLAVALAKQAASIQARHGIEVQIDLGDEPQMVLATKESLYRVAREALHNVVKHASATRIMLRMQCDDSMLQLDVIDNGIGFETSKDFPGHLGLHSMRERVVQMGGEISIKSTKGSGTQLSVTLPV